ncbi:hypothetical protein DPEC_G00184490 [Dallia pectoralis]|uniref:Uncharacterized protein n=1 Tax=Dallia pectoralis TaxID=75939 RepID=A0ACC2GB82_DALPE|nr:hypothetical protein DPEC_G00184490 [Dallia pectoralis]
MLCLSSQVLCFLLGTPALVWCLWISLSGSISGGLKPTQIFPISLFAVELVFCIECFLECRGLTSATPPQRGKAAMLETTGDVRLTEGNHKKLLQMIANRV